MRCRFPYTRCDGLRGVTFGGLVVVVVVVGVEERYGEDDVL